MTCAIIILDIAGETIRGGRGSSARKFKGNSYLPSYLVQAGSGPFVYLLLVPVTGEGMGADMREAETSEYTPALVCLLARDMGDNGPRPPDD